MNSEIIIVDNLYDNPFQYHEGFLNNQCIITDETQGKISQILGNPIEILSATNEKEGISGITAHLSCDWIALIYLELPVKSFGEFGVKFYSHIETGLEKFPSKEELIKFDITDENIAEVFKTDLNLWKEYGNVPAKYNRMVLFRGDRWHSYNIKLNTFMIYQKIIIKNV